MARKTIISLIASIDSVKNTYDRTVLYICVYVNIDYINCNKGNDRAGYGVSLERKLMRAIISFDGNYKLDTHFPFQNAFFQGNIHGYLSNFLASLTT